MWRARERFFQLWGQGEESFMGTGEGIEGLGGGARLGVYTLLGGGRNPTREML